MNKPWSRKVDKNPLMREVSRIESRTEMVDVFSGKSIVGTHRKALAVVVILVVMTAFLLVIFLPRILVVPSVLYPTIQSAIDSARAGDTVFVRNGYYTESFTIDKPLSLIGENSQNTIIEGPPLSQYRPQFAVQVSADRITISGFTIKGAQAQAAIWISITGSERQPSGCRITSNNIVNGTGNGIITFGGDLLTISDNNITGNLVGISLSSSDSDVSGNYMAGNGHAGIIIDGCANVTVAGNIIRSNAVNEPETDGRAGLLLLRNGPFRVYGNNITENKVGVQFGEDCNNSTVNDNFIERNSIGIDLRNYAISENDTFGSGNVVCRNNLIDNSQNAVVEHAYPQNTSLPVYLRNGTDIVSWDNGKEGNHWSDYANKYPSAVEVDNTGIWSRPYMIDASNIDNCPLTALDVAS